MQVALFDDNEVNDVMYRNIGKVKKSTLPKLAYSESELFNLLGYVPTGRHYETILNYEYDNCYQLESLGLFSSSRNYIIEVDLSERLDLVFSILTGCNPVDVRKIPNYNKVSKALLTVDVDNFNIPLLDLFGLSPEIDNFLLEVFDGSSEIDGLITLLKSLLACVDRIITYLGCYLQMHTLMVMRSIGRASFIMTSNKSYGEDFSIVLNSDSGDSFEFPITFKEEKKKSYKELIQNEPNFILGI